MPGSAARQRNAPDAFQRPGRGDRCNPPPSDDCPGITWSYAAIEIGPKTACQKFGRGRAPGRRTCPRPRYNDLAGPPLCQAVSRLVTEGVRRSSYIKSRIYPRLESAAATRRWTTYVISSIYHHLHVSAAGSIAPLLATATIAHFCNVTAATSQERAGGRAVPILGFSRCRPRCRSFLI